MPWTQTWLERHAHRGPRQSSMSGSGLDGGWPRLALNQGGRWSEAQQRPGHHYTWVASHSLPSRRRRRRVQTTTEPGVVGGNCHWGACLLWLIINYCAAGSKASVSAATSSVKHTAGTLLTALRFGCPLVELELGEQGAILMVLLHIQAHSMNRSIISGCTKLMVCS